MKRELTEEDIRENLKKEYTVKQGRIGTLAILAGIIFIVLCLTAGRLIECLLGIIILLIGLFERIKSICLGRKIMKDKLIIREERCEEKYMRMAADGQRRYFCFPKDKKYIASKQDMKLWEKTKPGDKFYLVYLKNPKKIMKIYPQKVLQYVQADENV